MCSIVEQLVLNLPPELLNFKGARGITPLAVASRFNRAAIVNLLAAQVAVSAIIVEIAICIL